VDTDTILLIGYRKEADLLVLVAVLSHGSPEPRRSCGGQLGIEAVHGISGASPHLDIVNHGLHLCYIRGEGGEMVREVLPLTEAMV